MANGLLIYGCDKSGELIYKNKDNGEFNSVDGLSEMLEYMKTLDYTTLKEQPRYHNTVGKDDKTILDGARRKILEDMVDGYYLKAS
tara:strand:+ start:4059 stop:4316 length:258 start_codon:yes stop_codon:yes gene_type:complete